MNWENLADFRCPYCGKALMRDLDKPGHWIKCTTCRFTIDRTKFTGIIRNQMTAGRRVQFKWQNLHEERCPVSGHRLR